MTIDFSNQTALVTGATRGIGAAIAKSLGEAGASLILTGTQQADIDRRNRQLDNQNMTNIRWYPLEFGNPESTEKFLAQIEQLSGIDILINNAGINRLSTIDEISNQEIDDILAVNLRGPMLLSRAVSRSMKKNRSGRIVNIASVWSQVTKSRRVAYTATKHGIVGMTKTMAVDLAAYNILVNAVSPGFTDTELTRQSMDASERERICQQVPLGRLAEPEEIAKVVLFLASQENTYLTAQNIIVDGGFCYV